VWFQECDLTDTVFTNTALDDVIFAENTPLTWQQFRSTQNGQSKNFSAISIYNNTVSGWDFTDANLVDKRWYGCDFPECVFDNAVINVEFFSTHLVKATSENANIHLKKGLTRTQFESTANYRSKDLKKADFNGCDLIGIDFSGFDLTGARFAGANLTDVCFNDATIQNCEFAVQSFIEHSTPLSKDQFYSTQSYKNGVIENVKFERIDLSGWDFSGKKLIGCRFNDCRFADTDFTDTQLENVLFANWERGWPLETPAPVLTIQQMKQTWNYKNQKMNQIGFEGYPGYYDEELKQLR
jgi:uncharacterized protein YjbI with pentapeptide repeats